MTNNETVDKVAEWLWKLYWDTDRPPSREEQEHYQWMECVKDDVKDSYRQKAHHLLAILPFDEIRRLAENVLKPPKPHNKVHLIDKNWLDKIIALCTFEDEPKMMACPTCEGKGEIVERFNDPDEPKPEPVNKRHPPEPPQDELREGIYDCLENYFGADDSEESSRIYRELTDRIMELIRERDGDG